VLVIDEAPLLKIEVFAGLHTLTRFDGASKPRLPLIPAGMDWRWEHTGHSLCGSVLRGNEVYERPDLYLALDPALRSQRELLGKLIHGHAPSAAKATLQGN